MNWSKVKRSLKITSKATIKKLGRSNINSFNAIATIITISLTLVNLSVLKQQNRLVEQSSKFQQDNLGFEIDKRSQAYVSNAYNNIFQEEELIEILEQLNQNQPVEKLDGLLKLIDVIEETGSNFCQGTAKARHIKIYLNNTLEKICNNFQVNEEFRGKKNGTAILCYEFYPDSLFAKNLNLDNIDSCEFVDSSRFPETGNRYRFELK